MAATGDELNELELRALGRAVRGERIKAGYGRVGDLAAVAGVSRKTLGKLERGASVAVATVLAVEPHIGWAPYDWLRIARAAAEVASAAPGRPKVTPLPLTDDQWVHRLDRPDISPRLRKAILATFAARRREEEARRREEEALVDLFDALADEG